MIADLTEESAAHNFSVEESQRNRVTHFVRIP